MKAKPVIICTAVFLVGATLGTLGALLFCGKMIAESLTLLKMIELRKSADSAHQAYKEEDPKIAIWALGQHLKVIDELRAIGYPEPELDTHAIITHGRLAKIYHTLQNVEKKTEHVQECIALSKASGHTSWEDITSEEGLWPVLEEFDKRDVP